MISHQTIVTLFFTLSLLSTPAFTKQPVRYDSLWGEVADFTSKCNHWTLNPIISIPALQELTICFDLKLELQYEYSSWTAFIYHHPEFKYADLGLGVKIGRFVIWLFGMEWATPEIPLAVSHWYSLCLTWKHTRDKPALYINGNLVDIFKVNDAHTSSSVCPLSCELHPNGTLTLGQGNPVSIGRILTIPLTPLFGKLTLFRIWGRERSPQELKSLKCTEGDVVSWNRDNWDTTNCNPYPDSSHHCEWSIYEVKLTFLIIYYDWNTEHYTAQDVAYHWLSEVLSTGFYLHSVSVFEVTRSSTNDSLDETLDEDRLVLWTPSHTRFRCLAYVNAEPRLDVAFVQEKIPMDLKNPYHHSSGSLQLLAHVKSMKVTAVENFPAATTTSRPDVVTDTSPVTTATFKSTASVTTTGSTTSPSTSVATCPTFTTGPANISHLYFQVMVNVSITADSDAEWVLSIWLSSTLPNDTMMFLDLHLLPKPQGHDPNLQCNLPTSEAPLARRVLRKSCIFQVKVMMPLSNTQETEKQIRHLLQIPYNSGSVSIAADNIHIKPILTFNCNAETQQTRQGLFEWPTTTGGTNATQPCPKNPDQNATRYCKLCLNTDWMPPDLQACSLVVETIPDLDRVEVTAENAQDVVDMIDLLLVDYTSLTYEELSTVLNKLQDVINVSAVTPNMGQSLVNVISNISESDSDLQPFTNIILNITETVGDRMVGYEGSLSLVARTIAISVVDVVPGQFSSLTFGVSFDRESIKPEIFINSYSNSTVAFISLPSALQQSFPENSGNQSLPRITFQFYGNPTLFRSTQKGKTLNTFVVSASVTNASYPIQDLDEEVRVTFQHLTSNTLHKDVQCVYWNFNENSGKGGWDNYGCKKYSSTSDYTTCLSDHLTHFGVLLDVSRDEVDLVNERILTIITYVGCGVSSLFLGITVLTYTAFEKLRRDYPSQILINLSLALLGLNLLFLLNSWLSSWGVYGLCVAAASTMHYFLLASFTWMGLEAVNMYFALVKVFNVYVPSYILKFCAVGWGIPLVICVLVLTINKQAYGSYLDTDAQSSLEPLDNSDSFCWFQDDVTFYVSVVAYALLVSLLNLVVFVVVLIQIRHMRVNSPAGTRSGLMHNLKGVASLTLLLGLTWTIGFFTWGPARIVLLYLFSGFNSLQGLFIFIFHCLMKENVRKQWRIHLCFGRFRLDEYSDWSNSGSVGVVAKPKSNLPEASGPSVHSVKSSSTDSTSASSDSKQPNLGLFVNSLALPRAQRNPSGKGALPSHRGMNLTPGWRNHLLSQQEQR